MMKIDRTGERRLMNCGEYATIIRYGGYTDIDVRFDSGEVVQSKVYRNFISGSIAKPIPNRVGERHLMNCGEYATIIEYRSCNDIDVKFDSGDITCNKSYYDFKRGKVSKPQPSKVGERRLMLCGEYATIIRYGNILDVDIQFDDGEIVLNKRYAHFVSGRIGKYKSRVGERRLMSCGEYATIIRYRSYNDIDVKFDSGEIVCSKKYSNFIKGWIPKSKPNRLDERRLMSCGEYATIIGYRSYNDIDVKFDSGIIVTNKSYDSFSKGYISNPVKVNKKIGERRLMNCGEYATIIGYRTYTDIDIKFDSGEIVKSKSYKNFENGGIAKPHYGYIGKVGLMKCGLNAVIVKYNRTDDMEVKFESGDILSGGRLKSFNDGSCSPVWYNYRKMRKCYYDKVLNDVIILMRDGRVLRKSKLLGGIDSEE